jgi:hypothetical protein
VVAQAQQVLLTQHAAAGKLTDPDPAAPRGSGGGYNGDRSLTHHSDFLALIESPRIFAFFASLFGEPSLTFDYKWVRVVDEGATGCHVDRVYMGRGSQRLLTCWTPLGAVPLARGPLMVLPGSHRAASLQRVRATYGACDVDRDHIQGWFSTDPAEVAALSGLSWASADMASGDAVVFGLDLMHASLPNQTGHLRLSCDVRFQPAAEPADERWIGEKAKGHYAWSDRPVIPIAESRAAWGV